MYPQQLYLLCSEVDEGVSDVICYKHWKDGIVPLQRLRICLSPKQFMHSFLLSTNSFCTPYGLSLNLKHFCSWWEPLQKRRAIGDLGFFDTCITKPGVDLRIGSTFGLWHPYSLRINVKTDRSRSIIAFILFYSSHKRSHKGFFLFVNDNRRFYENWYQQGLIVYQTLRFHQYLFLLLTKGK